VGLVTLSKQDIKSRISRIVENHEVTVSVPHLLVTVSKQQLFERRQKTLA